MSDLLAQDIAVEQAGRAAAQRILDKYFDPFEERLVVAFCACDALGARGLAAARTLAQQGVPVICTIVGGDYPPVLMRGLKRAFVCHMSVKEVFAPQDAPTAAKAFLAINALGDAEGKSAQAMRARISTIKNIFEIT